VSGAEDKRIDELLQQMTLEEKVAQLGSISVRFLLEGTEFSEQKAQRYLANGIGQITRLAGGANITASQAAEAGNHIQRYLTTKTRLRIPALVHEECLAGLLGKGATIFPVPIAMAATWDPELVRELARSIASCVRATGGQQGLCPVLDVVRDPRWGRVEETFGEDHHLVARMGVAYVQGLQGKDLKEGIMATGKHFAGHGFSEGGRNCAPVHVGPRELREVFLYPFERAVKEAGLASLMNAYHDLDGVPCACSRELLTTILREEWGFQGIVVSDYGAVARLADQHQTAEDYAEAAAQALEAGLDVELPNTQCYGAPLLEAVKRGRIAEGVIEQSVRRVLRMKLAAGVFESHQVEASRADGLVNTAAQRALSRRVAERSLVLLKNEGELLPLRRDIPSLAVVGPSAHSRRNLLGDYSFATHVDWNENDIEIVTVLEGMRSRLSADTLLRYARGCEIGGTGEAGFAEAVAAARASELCVFVGGDQSGLNLPTDTTGEGRDRAELGLPGAQEKLLRALAATGTPLVVVLLNGRIFDLTAVSESARAILEAWLPGEEGGNAVAAALFGEIDPGGRTPVSYPREAGQIPVNYNRRPSSLGKYVFTPAAALYPFGHGLSYTRFAYGGLELSPRVAPGDQVSVSFSLRNAGEREGEEVAQLYVRDRVASLTRPVKQLQAFRRLRLKPGETGKVSLSFPVEELAFYNLEMARVVEPGSFELMVGSSSEDIRLRGTFEVR
jgi:beta-glucosidase